VDETGPKRAHRIHPLRGMRSLNWNLAAKRTSLIAVSMGLFLYLLWPWLPGVGGPRVRTVVVYGFSILGEVMNEDVFPAFERLWQEQTGEQVEFILSVGASGTITNLMILGVPAEVAILSLELDAWRLVDAGVVPGPIWRDLPQGGILNRTPFIMLARPGNPKGIGSFADLTVPGVGVVHPDPLTSGGAQWAVVAAYGAALRETGDPDAAYAQLLGVWQNVVAQASSARAARTQFESGFGDVLITYEQEALRDLARGRLEVELVYPRGTIFSEHPVVVLHRNVRPENRTLVEAFVDFLWSEKAQRMFVAHGFRSVYERLNAENPDFGHIEDGFVIADFGGWRTAKEDIVDAVWHDRVLVEVGR